MLALHIACQKVATCRKIARSSGQLGPQVNIGLCVLSLLVLFLSLLYQKMFILPAVGSKAPAVVNGGRKASPEVIGALELVQEVLTFLNFLQKA